MTPIKIMHVTNDLLIMQRMVEAQNSAMLRDLNLIPQRLIIHWIAEAKTSAIALNLN